MNLYNIINEIEQTDAEFKDRISPRRQVIRDLMDKGAKITIAAMPLFLASLFKKAYGQDNVSEKIEDVLNFALTLEHLEYHFYEKALNTPGLVKSKDNILVIRNHEREHVEFLTKTIKATGATPVAAGKYDFTAGGKFADVFSNYKTFLLVAQAFEDTGVRAYKGEAGKLKKNDPILQAALQIHSVEARHAAHIRFARRVEGYNATVKPWIVGTDHTEGTPLEAVYKGEDNHTQVLFGTNNISGYDTGMAGTSAFDEPLGKDDVLAIVKPFIVAA